MNESGRSMVEMLGVLAIIGVLSVGGIAGYTQAMKKYKANEAVNKIAMAAVMCYAEGNHTGIDGGDYVSLKDCTGGCIEWDDAGDINETIQKTLGVTTNKYCAETGTTS